MSVTRDTFGRAVVTHVCPECGAQFLGPAECRPCPANNFAHPVPVTALPLVGCEDPPDVRWAVALGCIVMAQNEEQAYEMARGVVESTLPKRVVERYGFHFHPVPLESRSAAVARILDEKRPS